MINMKNFNTKTALAGLTALFLAILVNGCATNSQQPGISAKSSGSSNQAATSPAEASLIQDFSQSLAKADRDQRQSGNVSVERIHYLPQNAPGDIGQLVNTFESHDYERTNHTQYSKKPENPANEALSSNQSSVIDLSFLNDSNTNVTPNDLWDRIRLGFRLDYSHPRIKGDLKWYREHQAYLDRVVDRATPYLHYIVSEAEKRGIPTEIALLPIVESAFQPFAYSHGRAAGIWQFIPGTGKMYGLKQNWWYDGRRDIYASTDAAFRYLSSLHKQFNNDWLLALAAYNSGGGTVRKSIRKNKRKNKPTDFWSLHLPRETRGYVPKLLAISSIVADPAKYNIKLKSIPDTAYLKKVNFKGQIDLALAAELAGISQNDIYRYNPAFNRWATDPNGPNFLLVPIEKADQFTEKLANLPPKKRTRWKKHRIRKGETLGQIARRYQTTPSVIRQVNKFRGNNIRAGRDLIIPVAVKQFSTYTQTAGYRKKSIQNTKRKGTKVTYRVKTGDSFWAISRKYGVSVRQLAKWNSMAPRDPLKRGQRLTIWSKNSKSLNTASRAAPPTSEITRKINYVVRKGDSLARIANKFSVTISQLQRWNRLPKNKYLQPGQRIKLFIDITRQSW